MDTMNPIADVVLANLLTNISNCKLFKDRNLNAAYFLEPEKREFFNIIWNHYTTKNDILAKDSLESYMRQSNDPDDKRAKWLVFYSELLYAPKASNFDVVLDEFVLWYKTQTIGKAFEAATSIMHDKNPDEALETVQAELNKLRAATSKKQDEGEFIGSTDLIALYETRRDHPELFKGIELGFPTLDAELTHKPGTVTLIIGQMKSAKSVLMVNIANNLLSQGKKVYYHVNEGGLDLVRNRLISCASGLPMTKIERTLLNVEERAIYDVHAQQFTSNPFLYVDPVPSSFSTSEYISAKVTALEETLGKFDAILVDYLGLMNTTKKVDAGWQVPGAIALELKDLAMKHKVPVIVIAHVNRKGMQEDKKHFDMDEMGLSIEPLKHVDVIASWRIHELELFEKNNIGLGTLSVRGSRQSGQVEVVLDVDTNKMKIWEKAHHRITFAPAAATTSVSAPAAPVAPTAPITMGTPF